MNLRPRAFAPTAFCLGLAGNLLAAPIPFPTDQTPPTYSADFNAGVGTEWTLTAWQTAAPQSGVNELTATGGNAGEVRAAAPSGLDDQNFGGAVFPLDALLPARSYTDLGFTGDWLENGATGMATEDPVGVFTQENEGRATVEFNNLPAHQSIDIKFRLAAGGSFDYGENVNKDGPFRIEVDGVEALNHAFNGGGSTFAGTPGVGTLATSENLMSMYREQWNENDGTGPADADDRFSLNWVTGSAYDVGAAESLIAIPHSADTLTVDFIHQLSSGSNDELVAIDDIEIVLNPGLVSSQQDWPTGAESFTETFDGGAGPAWTFEKLDKIAGDVVTAGGWEATPVPDSGYTELTKTQNQGGVRTSAGGFDEAAFGADDTIYPLAPIIAPSSYPAETGGAFSGGWIQTLGVGNAVDDDGADGFTDEDTHNQGIARLELNNLPPHTGLDLTFAYASGGSIDRGSANASHDGLNEVRVQGVTVWSYEPQPNALNGAAGVTTLVTGGNLTGFCYREEWNDNGGTGPTAATDRTPVAWTTDSGYDVGSVPELTDIPHSSNSLVLEFIHRVTSNVADEHLAIDNVTVSLDGITSALPFSIIDLDYDAGLGQVSFEFPTVPNQFFVIQRAYSLEPVDGLNPDAWTELDDSWPSAPAPALTTTYTDLTLPPGTERAFYRVISLP